MPFGGHFADAVRRARRRLITAVATALTTRKRTAAAFVTWRLHKGLHPHRTLDTVQPLAKEKAPAPMATKAILSLVWDHRRLIAANLRGTVPWTKDPATPGT